MNDLLSAPSAINLELTDVCNVKCRHCYNFWREEGDQTSFLTRDELDRFIDIFVDAGIFHVVLTGGEPFTNFEVLEYGIKKLLANNISVSCNSNLMLNNEVRSKRLVDAGLDHILTSLNSHDPETNDYMVHQKGAYKKIINGIEVAVKNGIRISVNMIVSEKNKDHVYKTAKLCHNLGCQKIFGTRTVPSVNESKDGETEFHLLRNDAIHTLEQLVKAKEDTGIMIGTLVSYPLCFLSDLERYKDFVGRGCPAQRGQVIGINANGESHACVHESESYGNIFDIGIYKVYENMQKWHNGSYKYNGCDGCRYIDVCQSGCRLFARAYFGSLDQKDILMQSKDSFSSHYEIVYDSHIYKMISDGLKFFVPKRLRFRKENGFYLLNIRWANTIKVSNSIAEFLLKYRGSGETFDINDFGIGKRETLAMLFFKDAIESKEAKYEDLRNKFGLSVDPVDLSLYS